MFCQFPINIEWDGEGVRCSERGSVTIEATVVISLVLMLLFGCLGTLLTIFVDSQMEWVIQSASDEMNIIAIPISDRTDLLRETMRVKVDKQVAIRAINNFVEIKDILFEKVDNYEINMWEVSYDYKFVSFSGTESILVPFKSGNEDDGLRFESSTVFVTKYGEKYHIDLCFHLRKSKFPIDLDAALQRGYEPCKNCHNNIESR